MMTAPFDPRMKHSPLEMWMKPGRDAAGLELWAKPGREAFEFWVSFFPTAPLFGVEWRFASMANPVLNPFMMPGMPGMPGARAAAHAARPGELTTPAAADENAAKPVARATDMVGEAAKDMARIAGETSKAAVRATGMALTTGVDATSAALKAESKAVDIAEETGKAARHATGTAASAAEGAATTAKIAAEETAETVGKSARRGSRVSEEKSDTTAAKVTETAEVVEHAIAAGPKPKMLLAKRPDEVDDLKAIKGIGPDLERQLNGLGLYRFDQLAKMTDADLAWIDANITRFKGRGFRDDWIGQAKSRLAK